MKEVKDKRKQCVLEGMSAWYKYRPSAVRK